MGYRDETFGLRIDSELKTLLDKIATDTRLSMSDLVHDCCYTLLPIIQNRLLWTQLQEQAKTTGRPISDLLLEALQYHQAQLTLNETDTRKKPIPQPPVHAPVHSTYPPARRRPKK